MKTSKLSIPWLGCGSEFYPDQWPENMWDAYLAQIREAGLEYLRLFELAWGALEPEMDRFEWEWADRFLDKLDALGIRYLLGTPAAGPPRWLFKNYPEARIAGPWADGGEYTNRRNGCPSQPEFRRRVSIIQRAMAERWGRRQGLIGWQIDNELGHPECRCARCRERFIDWLKARFETPERLTQVCGLTMWSHQLRHWEDLDIPTESHNPALRHLFRAWNSEKWLEFASACRAELVRDRLLPATVNMMVPWHGYDHFQMAERMELVGVDYYPFMAAGAYKYTTVDFDLSMGYARALGRGQPFWILETQAGGVNRLSPPPGAILDWSLRAVAHGANAVTFFRWDTPNFGGEELQYGVVGPGLYTDRIYTEVKAVAHRLRSLRPLLEESVPERAPVGIYFNYTSWWKDLDQWSGVKGSEPRDSIHNYLFLLRRHLAAFETLGISADLCGPGDDLSHYRLLVAPYLCSLSLDEAQTLHAWAAQGGTLLLAEPGFTHDEIGVGYLAPYPGPECLRQSAGVHHGVGGRLLPGCRPTVRSGKQDFGKVVQWAEQLEIDSPSTKIVATYGDDATYAPWPALTVCPCEKGQVALLGCMLDDYAELYRHFIVSAGLSLPVTPAGWWVRVRRHPDGRRIVFQKNMTSRVATLNFEHPVTMEDGSTVTSLQFQSGELKIFTYNALR